MQLIQEIVTSIKNETTSRKEKSSDAILRLQSNLSSPVQFKNFSRSSLIGNLLSLGPTDLALLCWMVHFSFKVSANTNTFVTQNRLAQTVGVSTKTVQRFIIRMESRGVLIKLPQAIRERNGALYFGPMQNRFSDAFRQLMTSETININSRVEHLSLANPQKINEKSECHQLPKNLKELTWLYDLLNQNKSLVLKLVKLAGKHIKNGSAKTLNEMLCSYRTALETGEIKNPSAYLITRLMSSKWTPYSPPVLSDKQHEYHKLMNRRAEEAKQSRMQLHNKGQQKIESILENQSQSTWIEMVDLTTNVEYRILKNKTIQIHKEKKGWSTITNAEDFFIKVAQKHIAQKTNCTFTVRQNSTEKSNSLNKTKFLKQRQQVNGDLPKVESFFIMEESSLGFSKIKNQNKTASTSAIDEMRKLLKMTLSI